MTASVNLRVDDSGLKRLFAELRRRGGNLAGVNAAIAEDLVAAVLDVFEDEGPGWAPLAESTLANRRGKAAGAKILQDTSILAGSVHPDSGASFAEAYSDVPYGVFHVMGTDKMPRRDFMAIDFDEVTRSAADLLLAEIARR